MYDLANRAVRRIVNAIPDGAEARAPIPFVTAVE